MQSRADIKMSNRRSKLYGEEMAKYRSIPQQGRRKLTAPVVRRRNRKLKKERKRQERTDPSTFPGVPHHPRPQETVPDPPRPRVYQATPSYTSRRSSTHTQVYRQTRKKDFSTTTSRQSTNRKRIKNSNRATKKDNGWRKGRKQTLKLV